MIELRGLTKRYGGKLAVDRLTFDIRPGRVTGFLWDDPRAETRRRVTGATGCLKARQGLS